MGNVSCVFILCQFNLGSTIRFLYHYFFLSLNDSNFLIAVHGRLSLLRSGLKVITKLFSCSTQLSRKFIMLINGKMPTIDFGFFNIC